MTANLNIKKETFYYFTGQIISMMLGGITTIYIVRVMPQNEYGMYQQILFFIYLCSHILKINFENGLFYFFHRFNESKSLYVVNVYNILFFISLFTLFCGGIVIISISDSFDSELRYHLLPIVLLLSLNISLSSFEKLFVIENMAIWSMYYKIIFAFIKSTLVIAVLVKYVEIYYILIAIICIEIIKIIFVIYYLKIKHRFIFGKFDKSLILKMLKYNLKVSLSWIIGRIGQSIDKVMLIGLVSNANFAIYSLGCIQLPLLSIFYNSIGDVTLTKISLLSSENKNTDQVIKIYKKMVSINAMIALPLLFFSYLHVKHIYLLLFGKPYLDSTIIFMIINTITLIQITGFGYIIKGYGKTNPLLISNSIRLILGLILGYTLIKHMDIVGAATAYALTFFINGFILLFYSSKIIGASIKKLIPWKMILKITLISIPSIIAIYPLRYLNIDILHFIIISIILYTTIIVVLYLKNDLLTTDSIKGFYDELY